MTESTDPPITEPSERASRLTPELLVALFAVDPAPGGSEWQLRAAAEGQSTELDARWLDCGPAPQDPNRWWLITAPVAREFGARLEQFELRAGESTRELVPEAALCTPTELAAACREWFDAEQCGRIQEFLAHTPSAHTMPLSTELAAHLASMREELREPLPRTKVAPGPLSARLEEVTALDDHGFWLTGWIHDASPSEVRLTAVSPEGARSEVMPGAITFHERPAYSEGLQDDADASTLGFHAYVELDQPSLHPHGWVLEFHTASGEVVEDPAHEVVRHDNEEIVQRIREQLRVEPQDEIVLENLVLPALTRLRGGAQEAHIEEVIDYGEAPASPDVSIVVAVRRLDRIEHQLAAFARDPEIRSVELIYLAAEPPTGVGLTTITEELHDLYGIPFRLTKLTRQALRPRALNLGSSIARGRLLVLMSSDVLPAQPGWITKLRALAENSAAIVAVGPKLLHEDDSIAHAGVDYAQRGRPAHWQRLLPLAGLARTLDAASAPRRVTALSDSCMMVDAQEFRASGGFTELYLDTGDEAGDLCLRLARRPGEIWYTPDAELYLLDRPDIQRNASPVRDRFNQWLFERRCGGRLETALARDRGAAGLEPAKASDPGAAEPPAPAPAIAAMPISDSGRSGSPIEALEVVSAEVGGDGQLLDRGLRLPEVDADRALYDSTYSFAITGWALARGGGAVTIEVNAKGVEPRRTTPNLPSEQVGKRFPDTPGADACAFQFVIGSLSLPAEFELRVEAVTEDGTRSPLGVVRGSRRKLRSGYTPTVQPLLVTMLGRTGSNWLITLLSRHPDIIAYSTFVYEPMLASYWSAVLRTLSDPVSYIQSMVPELYEGDWWTGRERNSPLPLKKPRNEMARWLGRENAEVVAGFCQSRLDAFYTELARIEGRSSPRYFVEKCVPGGTARTVAELYPESREIVLVRDFRDRVCSILDYNAKRGLQLWGRDRSESDEQWFQYLRAEAMDLLENWRERRERAYLVRYEDVIREPEITLAGMLSYLDLDASPEIVDRTLQRATELLPEAQRKHQTSSSVEESVGRWKRDLSPERQAACADAFDDLLVEFGYEPTGDAAAA